MKILLLFLLATQAHASFDYPDIVSIKQGSALLSITNPLPVNGGATRFASGSIVGEAGEGTVEIDTDGMATLRINLSSPGSYEFGGALVEGSLDGTTYDVSNGVVAMFLGGQGAFPNGALDYEGSYVADVAGYKKVRVRCTCALTINLEMSASPLPYSFQYSNYDYLYGRMYMRGGLSGTDISSSAVSFGTKEALDVSVTGGDNVAKPGTLVTTATTADQVVVTYTSGEQKLLYVHNWDISARLTTFATTATNFGLCSLESPAGTKLSTKMVAHAGNPVLPVGDALAVPIMIPAETVVRIVCTPSATTSFTWQGNILGYERNAF